MNQLNQQFGSEKLMQIETVERLVGIPPLIGFESPASWLTRAALSQGVSPWLLLKHLNLHPRADLDLALREKLAEKIVTVCQLDPNSFQFATKFTETSRRLIQTVEIFCWIRTVRFHIGIAQSACIDQESSISWFTGAFLPGSTVRCTNA